MQGLATLQQLPTPQGTPGVSVDGLAGAAAHGGRCGAVYSSFKKSRVDGEFFDLLMSGSGLEYSVVYEVC